MPISGAGAPTCDGGNANADPAITVNQRAKFMVFIDGSLKCGSKQAIPDAMSKHRAGPERRLEWWTRVSRFQSVVTGFPYASATDAPMISQTQQSYEDHRGQVSLVSL